MSQRDVYHSWCPPEEPAPVPEAPKPVTKTTVLLADAHFAFNQSSILDTQSLDNLINQINLHQVNIDTVAIIGYADLIGKRDYNYQLAMRRAKAV